MGERVKTMELFRGTGGAIAQNATLTSDPLELNQLSNNGVFSLHMITVGGTVTVTLLVCSTKTGTYMAPTTAVTIFNAVAAGSYFAEFTPPLAPFMKILFTETNVAAVTAMDAWLNYQ